MLKPPLCVVAMVVCVALPPREQAAAKMTSVDVTCLGSQRCTKMSNGTVDVVVTRDVGPRIIAYGFVTAGNVFGQMPLPAGQGIDPNRFNIWGGHRLWHAPEQLGRSDVPDNTPPHVFQLAPGHLRMTAPVEMQTNLQKELEVKLDNEGSQVTVIHRLKNVGPWSIEAAPWAVSVMHGGGTAIVPNEPTRPHPQALLPVRPMALWAYTNLGDKRFAFGPLFTRVSTDGTQAGAQKVGVGNRQGWVAYLREETLFVKRMPFEEGVPYPDFGCNTEIYTAGDFIEIESLAPLRPIGPGQVVEHVESWHLWKGVAGAAGDPALAAVLAPLIAQTKPPGVK